MKIVFLARRFSPDIGGVEKHVLEISRLLIKDGYKVLVITQSQGEKFIDGIEVERIKAPDNWFSKFYIWLWLFKNRKYLQSTDIVHAHDVYFWYLPFRLIFPRKKSYITFHGYENYPIKKRAIILRRISENASNGSIIVGDYIKKWYGAKSELITYGGVKIPKSFNKPVNISAVFVGRLEENTGILEYVNAVDLIRLKLPEFKFTIVGDGRLKNQLDKYNLVGFKAETSKYIQEAEFVFASGYLSILEAMANKKVAVAVYDNALKKNYLNMTPFASLMLVCNSAEDITTKISNLINNPKEKEKMEQSAFEFARTMSWEKVKDVYLKLWSVE